MPLVAVSPTLYGMFAASLLGAVIDLNGKPRYVHHGWFLISTANLTVIVLMLAVFALAIVLPFPGGKDKG
jgi:hypothetical protein